MKKLLLLISMMPLAAMAGPMTDKSQSDRECDGKRHYHGMKSGQHAAGERWLKGLDLSEAQQAQLKDMMAQQREARQTRGGEMWRSQRAMHELARAEKLDEAELARLADKAAEAHRQGVVERVRFQHELYSLLTPEQREQLAARVSEGRKGKHKAQ